MLLSSFVKQCAIRPPAPYLFLGSSKSKAPHAGIADRTISATREYYVPFTQQVEVEGNAQLRIPQRAGWVAIRDHFAQAAGARDVGVVLPVGCGKSGLIAITPFALGARRALVIAP